MMFFISKKEGFHEDEMFSYGSSNYAYDNVFRPYGTADELNTFIIKDIVKNNFFETLKNFNKYFIFEKAEKERRVLLLKALSTETASCFLHQGKISNIMEYFLAAGKAVETILVMVDAEETPERIQNIIKKYIPDGQKAKAMVMERNADEDWNSFRRRFVACQI